MTTEHPDLTELYSPKFILLAFQLCKTLTETADDADQLWGKLAGVGEKLRIPTLYSLPTRVRPYLANLDQRGQPQRTEDRLRALLPEPNTVMKIDSPDWTDSLRLVGGVYPFWMHDTYAVDVTLGYPDQVVSLAQLSALNSDGCWLPKHLQASLGQVMIVFAQVDSCSNLAAIADRCVQALLPNQRLRYPTVGRFLGGWLGVYDDGQLNPVERLQVWVWLSTEPRTVELEARGDYYYALVQLVLSRNKILLAYHEARSQFEAAKQIYGWLEGKAERFSQLSAGSNTGVADSLDLDRLNELEGWLIEIPQKNFEFARCLRNVELQLPTLAINVENYDHFLEQLSSVVVPEDDLGLFESIGADSKLWIEQIRYDQAYLMAGKVLFDQMIESIRGLVEVDAQKQALRKDEIDKTRDRNLQIWFTVVGSGLAISSLSATIQPKPIETIGSYFAPTFKLSEPVAAVVAMGFNLLFHILIGFTVALLARRVLEWLILRVSKD